jgi:hypothetical protein
MRTELKGDDSNPQNPIVGLIDIGDGLYTEVQKITTGG